MTGNSVRKNRRETRGIVCLGSNLIDELAIATRPHSFPLPFECVELKLVSKPWTWDRQLHQPYLPACSSGRFSLVWLAFLEVRWDIVRRFPKLAARWQ